MSAYADTSFLVSLYVPDSNSAAASARMSTQPLPVLITPLGELELLNALQLYVFRKQIEPRLIRRAITAVRADLRSGVLLLASPPETLTYAEARRLAARWTAKLGVRALDILHVASAVVLKADSFHTFDYRQRKLAVAADLHVP